jgi:hypothetical protein
MQQLAGFRLKAFFLFFQHNLFTSLTEAYLSSIVPAKSTLLSLPGNRLFLPNNIGPKQPSVMSSQTQTLISFTLFPAAAVTAEQTLSSSSTFLVR